MNLPTKLLQKSPIPLTSFEGNQVKVEGEITLFITLGMEPCKKTFPLNFVVVRTPSAYNAIFGRSAMNKFRVVPSTYHFMIKFLTRNGIDILRGDLRLAKQCLLIQDRQSDDHFTLEQLDPREEIEGCGEPVEQTISIPLREDDPTKVIQIRSLLD